jgi:hypothetical protein
MTRLGRVATSHECTPFGRQQALPAARCARRPFVGEHSGRRESRRDSGWHRRVQSQWFLFLKLDFEEIIFFCIIDEIIFFLHYRKKSSKGLLFPHRKIQICTHFRKIQIRTHFRIEKTPRGKNLKKIKKNHLNRT